MRANCVICSDFFDEINPISAAPCGHVYHSSCLSLWIGQSQTCPQCRVRVSNKNILKLYFNFPPLSVTNTSELENEVINLKAQLSDKNIELMKCKKEKEDTAVFVRQAEKRASDLQQEVYKKESELSELRLRTKSVAKTEAKLLKLEQMNSALSNDLQHLNNVQTIVNGTQKDVEKILNEYNNNSEATKQLATYCTCLKRELQKVMESKGKLVELSSKLKRENGLFAAKVKFYEDAMAISSKTGNNSVGKETSLSNQKKSIGDAELNYSNASDIPSCSHHQSPDISLNVSPLTVSFNKSKFNMCIKTSSNVTYKSDFTSKDINPKCIPFRKKDDNSIIKTGYNGLGGHTKFINTSDFKRTQTLKRKL